MAVFNITENKCFNETNICTFRMVNGSILTAIGILGFTMSSTVLFLLVFNVIRLPGNKNIFIINVSMFDALLALVGTVRGLGIMNKSVLGIDDDLKTSLWCQIFTLIAAPLWESLVVSLIPLTVDRFVAIVYPRRYNTIITNRVSFALVVGSWMPLIALNVHDVVAFKLGQLSIEYFHPYNRCVKMDRWNAQQLVFLLLPLILICFMYSIMTVVIIKNKINATKIIMTTTAIIATSLVSTQPFLLMSSFGVPMSYEVSQILTVTCYYLNGVVNPIIYLCCNRKVQKQLRSGTDSRFQLDSQSRYNNNGTGTQRKQGFI